VDVAVPGCAVGWGEGGLGVCKNAFLFAKGMVAVRLRNYGKYLKAASRFIAVYIQ
jgi:hypothetical protein